MGNNKLQLCGWDNTETCMFYNDKLILGYSVRTVTVDLRISMYS